MTRDDAKTRFAKIGDAYARYRYRDYPRKVLDLIFQGLGNPRHLVVADIGAGTGISADLLTKRGARVIAIEPNAQMREKAPKNPLIEWRDGSAEATGLPDQSVDIVAAFQAFHWFDPEAALAEFRRIARHRIVSVQYEHEDSDPASLEFDRLLRVYSLDDSGSLRRHALETFAAYSGSQLRTSILTVEWPLKREELFGYVDSISFLPRDGEAAVALRADVDRLFETFARGETVSLPLRLFVLALDK